MGSLSVLLACPYIPKVETVNDKDGFLCNFWRAVQHDPDGVARYADQPSHEATLHARHAWLVGQRRALTTRLEGDPDYCDPQIAGWWLWGIGFWLGKWWCSGKGPWHVVDGELVCGVPPGEGVYHQLPHLHRPRGIHSRHARGTASYAWMRALCDRLRYVRVTCGDWTRVLGPTVTWKQGMTGIVLDPPYSQSERTDHLYAAEADIAQALQAWCLANGENPRLRIVLCGLSGEYTLPGWRQVSWTAYGGMRNQSYLGLSANKYRERLYLSPHCLYPRKHRTHGKLAVNAGV